MRPACLLHVGLLIFLVGLLPQSLLGQSIDEAVKSGLQIVQKAARNYPEHRQCFSCHHQTLPMHAMAVAASFGFEVDSTLLEEQDRFTRTSFHSRLDGLREGRGIGGAAMTVGYGLWALDLAAMDHDETTSAMVSYLLHSQEDNGSWDAPSNRPPLEESDVMATTIAAYYLQQFAPAERRVQVSDALGKARAWLETAERISQEDRNGRLWGLVLLDGDPGDVDAARAEVLASQREDGGFGQLDGMPSDAYATGQALYVLQASGVDTNDPAYQRGMQFLLKTQQPDGSWHVKTRSKPIQIYFDNGDPHGKDQFISIAATSWAVAALAGAR